VEEKWVAKPREVEPASRRKKNKYMLWS